MSLLSLGCDPSRSSCLVNGRRRREVALAASRPDGFADADHRSLQWLRSLSHFLGMVPEEASHRGRR